MWGFLYKRVSRLQKTGRRPGEDARPTPLMPPLDGSAGALGRPAPPRGGCRRGGAAYTVRCRAPPCNGTPTTARLILATAPALYRISVRTTASLHACVRPARRQHPDDPRRPELCRGGLAATHTSPSTRNQLTKKHRANSKLLAPVARPAQIPAAGRRSVRRQPHRVCFVASQARLHPLSVCPPCACGSAVRV